MLLIDSNNKITMTQGDTAYLKIQIPDYELKRGDQVYLSVSNAMIGEINPISGHAFKKEVRSFNDDGTATIKIEPEDTKYMEGTHFYDVQVVLSNGDIFTVIPKNAFELLEEVTR